MDLIGQRVGNYVIERALKKGGMGSVYIAVHPALDKRVAVKFLDAPTEQLEFSRRFLDEARITASLDHPNVVGIYDFGRLDGRFYYVMDLLVGHDLDEHLQRYRPHPAQCVEFLSQICAGLQAAHERGVVHRDLKPANIFVVEGEPPVLKLMDFGVAKVLAQNTSKTNYGQLLGTPAYMAPEQAVGDLARICAQTDLYAVGVIGYELLAGRRPFEHESPMMLLVAHIHEDFPPLRELAPQAPPLLCKLIEKCLQKNPTARPASAGELARNLRALQAGALEPLAERRAHAVSPPSSSHKGPKAPGVERDEEGRGSAAALTDRAASQAQLNCLVQGTPSSTKKEALLVETVNEPAIENPLAPAKHRRSTEAHEESEAYPLSETEDDLQLGDGEREVLLDDNDRSSLKKLFQRMKRRDDMPAFVANVGDVNKKADVDGKYSANQLSESILKDHALTAKLLRIVNTNYLNRFGGKIYSVQQAIVILGFEQVRSLALSISVFDKERKTAATARVADSAVHSLVSGELARTLAKRVGLDDEEESTVCAMFCNLGRHLALVYLPEQFDKALARSAQEKISLERAAEKEFGLSFQKIGIGVAEQWHLPTQLLEAMGASPAGGGKPVTEQQKLASLAHLSNELCELVADGLSSEHDPKLRKLLERHRSLVDLTPDEVPELLASVEETFRDRYSNLLGTKPKNSRFLKQLPELSPRAKQNAEKRIQADAEARAKVAGKHLEVEESGRLARPPERNRKRARRAVHGLVLGQPAEGNNSTLPHPQKAGSSQENEASPPSTLSTSVEKVRSLLHDQGQPEQALNEALRIVSDCINLPRVIALKPSETGSELLVSDVIGDDKKALSSEVRFELNLSRQANDVFSKAYNGCKDIFVKDTYSDKAAAHVPRRYYEVIGSPAFLILPCQDKKGRIALLLADASDPEQLPSRKVLSQLDELKTLIAAASAA